jgi:CshA-type fibril repeat protein
MTKLTYGDGTVATMSYTNIGAGEPGATVPATMNVNPSETFWGGQGDLSTAFSPTSLVGGRGLIVGWRSFQDRNIIGCLPSTDSANPQREDFTQYPTSPNPYVCSTPATVTFTFSRPTTDAIFNLHNLAGGRFQGYASFYLSWAISSSRSPGLTAELVSKAGNFEVANGNTIKPIQPPGKGLTSAEMYKDPLTGVDSPCTSNGLPNGTPVTCDPTRAQWSSPNAYLVNPSTPLDVAPQGRRTYYGSGSGAVRIIGTYTSVSFDVTLARYLNLELNSAAQYNWDIETPEFVQMNWNLPVAQAGTASPDTTWGLQGAVQTSNLLTNDVARSGDPYAVSSVKLCNTSAATPETAPNCTATSVTVPNVGTYAVSNTGVMTFTPLANYVGTPPALPYSVSSGFGLIASSTYTPTVSGATPVAVDDVSSGPFNQPQSKTVLANDTSSTSTPISASTLKLLDPSSNTYGTSPVTIANQGTYTISGDKIVFTPVNGFSGTATPVRYQVTDSSGKTANATYTPTIKPPSTLPSTGSNDVVMLVQSVTILLLTGVGSLGLASLLRRKTRRQAFTGS